MLLPHRLHPPQHLVDSRHPADLELAEDRAAVVDDFEGACGEVGVGVVV